jgi:hypothetical protein
MAAYFWFGGTGTWNNSSNANWSLTTGGPTPAGPPTAADTVTFDANSGTAAVVTVTATAVSLSTTINKADINLSLSGSPTLCTGACTLTAGTITLNTFTLTTGSFSSNNTNARTIAFGSGNITVTGVSGTVFAGPTSTNTGLTITGTAQVNVTGNGTTTRTVNPGNSLAVSAPISFTISAGSDTINSSAGMTFNNLTFTSGFTGTFGNVTRSIFGNLTLNSAITSFSSGASTLTFTGTGSQTITTASETIDCPITFNGVGGTWQLQDAMTVGSTRITTLTNGTLNLNSYTLTTGSFYSDNSNVRVLAFGTGKIVVTGNNCAPINIDTATNFSYTGTSNIEGYYTGASGVRYFVIGNTAGGSEAVAMNLNITTGTDAVYIYVHWNNVNFTGFAGTYGYLGNKIFYGSLTLVSGMYVASPLSETITFAATSGPKTITSAGNTIDYSVTFDGVGGTWACQDALTLGSTRALTITNGTLQLKSGTTSTVGSFVTTGTNQKYLSSTSSGTQATISDASGTNSVSYLTIQDSYATGGAAWDANASTNINAGNNFGWFFAPTPADSNEITMRLRSFTQPRRF